VYGPFVIEGFGPPTFVDMGFNPDVTNLILVVPEPATLLVVAIGLTGIAASRRRRSG
jgi:hypothetical protein